MPLVLTRQPHEKLVLITPEGQTIVIKAEYAPSDMGDGVRIMVDAPRDVTIVRGELLRPDRHR
jgi:sRNA-binding carbon storage regulator CsrA